MGLLDRVNARHAELKNPVGGALVSAGDGAFGHDSSRWQSPSPWSFQSENDAALDRVATADDVFSVISLRARLMSGLKLKVYRGTGSTRSEVQVGPAVNLLKHVNPFWSPRRLQRMDELSMGMWGSSFWAIEKDEFGNPREIWWLKPSRVRVVPDEFNYIKGYLYEPANGSMKWIPFAADEIVWFRYPNPLDEFASLSPLLAAHKASTAGQAMLDSNRLLFTQGMQMGGFVVPSGDKVSFTKAQADDLERFLETRFSGSKHAHRWGVLRFDATFKEALISPRDAQFIDGMNMTLKRVCNVYGVPSPLMNDLEHATLANASEFHKILWSDALVPDAELKSDEITEQLLPMFPGRPLHVEYDFTKVPALQESATSVWDRERQQIEAGSMTVNEWRESHGMPPVPWGDVWWAPVNKGAVSGPTTPAPESEQVPEEDAANALAVLDLKTLEFRHGPLTLKGQNGHGVNGHGRVRHE